MGTRSITHVVDEQGRTVVTIYRQYDGHPGEHGADIKRALTEHKWYDEYCAAALLVWALKAGEAGNVYLVPPGTSGVDEEFTYRVAVDEENTVQLTVEASTDEGVTLYDGPLADFKPEEWE